MKRSAARAVGGALAASLLAACPPPAFADTVYLCRAYGGGEFWSRAHCHQHEALVLRMSTVPSGLPFAQQVRLAESARQEGERLATPPAPRRVVNPAIEATAAECAALAARLEALTAQSRRILPALTQDRLNDELRGVHARRDALACR